MLLNACHLSIMPYSMTGKKLSESAVPSHSATSNQSCPMNGTTYSQTSSNNIIGIVGSSIVQMCIKIVLIPLLITTIKFYYLRTPENWLSMLELIPLQTDTI